MTVSNEQIAT